MIYGLGALDLLGVAPFGAALLAVAILLLLKAIRWATRGRDGNDSHDNG